MGMYEYSYMRAEQALAHVQRERQRVMELQARIEQERRTRHAQLLAKMIVSFFNSYFLFITLFFYFSLFNSTYYPNFIRIPFSPCAVNERRSNGWTTIQKRAKRDDIERFS